METLVVKGLNPFSRIDIQQRSSNETVPQAVAPFYLLGIQEADEKKSNSKNCYSRWFLCYL